MGQDAPTRTAVWLGGNIDEALADIKVPAWIVDRNEVIRWQNGRATELFGDVRGRRFSDMLAPEARAQARLEFRKKLLGTARTSDYESLVVGRSATPVRIEIHSVALADGQKVVGVFGLADEQHQDRRVLHGDLTARQQEVLVELARGCSTAQIAASLGISPDTVRNHVRAVLRALDVHSRLAAVAEGRRRGLID